MHMDSNMECMLHVCISEIFMLLLHVIVMSCSACSISSIAYLLNLTANVIQCMCACVIFISQLK